MKPLNTNDLNCSSTNIGAVHCTEILPTLKQLEHELCIDLCNNILGSAYNKEFSNDIDIAVSINTNAEKSAFLQQLKDSSVFSNVNNLGTVISTRTAILDYNKDISCTKERTGIVQVDFMCGEIDWLKVFYASNASKYKGAYRNILLGILSKHTSPNIVKATTYRFMFSPKNGLVRIKRKHVLNNAKTHILSKPVNKIIKGPWKTQSSIAEKLHLQNIDSFETIFADIEKYHTTAIISRIANEFIRNPTVKRFGIPHELEKYF